MRFRVGDETMISMDLQTGEAIFSGDIRGGTISIGSCSLTNSSSFHVAENGQLTIGGTMATPNFRVEPNGSVSIRFGTLDIGNGRFSVDSTGNLITQHATITGGSMTLGGTEINESWFRTLNGQLSNFFNSNFDASNNVHGGAITARTINAESIIANSISANEMASNSITANELAANSVFAGHITANAILTNHISAGAVTALEMNVNQLSAITADMGTLTAGSITGGTITANCVLNVETNASVGNILSVGNELALRTFGRITVGGSTRFWFHPDSTDIVGTINTGVVNAIVMNISSQPVATQSWVLSQLPPLAPPPPPLPASSPLTLETMAERLKAIEDWAIKSYETQLEYRKECELKLAELAAIVPESRAKTVQGE